MNEEAAGEESSGSVGANANMVDGWTSGGRCGCGGWDEGVVEGDVGVFCSAGRSGRGGGTRGDI